MVEMVNLVVAGGWSVVAVDEGRHPLEFLYFGNKGQIGFVKRYSIF